MLGGGRRVDRRVRFVGRDDHGVHGGVEFVKARARHNDRVAPSVRFLRDAQEPPAFVFAELDVEMFALHLELTTGDDVIHIGPMRREKPVSGKNGPRVMTHAPQGDNGFFRKP